MARWLSGQGFGGILACPSRAKPRSVCQFQLNPADSNHLAWSSHQQMTEIGELIRPVRNAHRIGVIRQIVSDMPGSLFATQLKVHAGRNEPTLRNAVLINPGMTLDRTSVVEGKSVYERVNHGGGGDLQNKKTQ